MRDHGARRRQRLPLVAALYGIGFSVESIAAIIGVSPATVINDRNALGGAKGFVERPREKRSLYRNAFAQYAAFCYESSQPGPLPKMDPAIAGILERWLRIPEVKNALGGAVLTMNEILAPGYPPERAGYARLLERVIGDWLRPAVDPEGRIMKNFWQSYLAAVANRIIGAPASYEDLAADVIRRFIADLRSDVCPVWDESAFQAVNRVLDELTKREREVIRRRFGLDTKAVTLDEIGREFSITRERVHQIEAQAIHKLRHPKYINRLRPLTHSVARLFADRMAAAE